MARCKSKRTMRRPRGPRPGAATIDAYRKTIVNHREKPDDPESPITGGLLYTRALLENGLPDEVAIAGTLVYQCPRCRVAGLPDSHGSRLALSGTADLPRGLYLSQNGRAAHTAGSGRRRKGQRDDIKWTLCAPCLGTVSGLRRGRCRRTLRWQSADGRRRLIPVSTSVKLPHSLSGLHAAFSRPFSLSPTLNTLAQAKRRAQ